MHAPGSAWRDPVTWTIAALVFGAYFAISLFRLLQLTPGSYDFGIYTEYVKQLSHLHAPVVDVRGPGFNLLGNHFQVLAGLSRRSSGCSPPRRRCWSPRRCWPRSRSSRSRPRRAARPGTGRVVGFAYGFSWGLQQMIDFDFHEIALAVPLLAFSVSALVRRRPLAAIAWAVPLVFVKEDQGFTVAAIGLLMAAGRARRPGGGARGSRRAGGLFLVAWGLAWSPLAITVIIPHFNPLHQYYFWGNGGVVGSGARSPSAACPGRRRGWPTKRETIALLLLPTAFVALGSPVALIALPSLLLRFISTNSIFWGTAFHYDATVMPILFIAAAESVARCRAPPRSPGHRTPGASRCRSGRARCWTRSSAWGPARGRCSARRGRPSRGTAGR